MTILAIDPGSTHSALVVWDGAKIIHALKTPNDEAVIDLESSFWKSGEKAVIVCERVECYGMPVGREVFETCFWTGRFWQTSLDEGFDFHLVPRREVKLHLCGQARAKDSNIRQALIDRFGPKGTIKNKALTLPRLISFSGVNRW